MTAQEFLSNWPSSYREKIAQSPGLKCNRQKSKTTGPQRFKLYITKDGHFEQRIQQNKKDISGSFLHTKSVTGLVSALRGKDKHLGSLCKTPIIGRPIGIALERKRTFQKDTGGWNLTERKRELGRRGILNTQPNSILSRADIKNRSIHQTHCRETARSYFTLVHLPRTQPKMSNPDKKTNYAGEEKTPETTQIKIENLQKVSDEYTDQKQQKTGSHTIL